jgi:hypothetical protein
LNIDLMAKFDDHGEPLLEEVVGDPLSFATDNEVVGLSILGGWVLPHGEDCTL